MSLDLLRLKPHYGRERALARLPSRLRGGVLAVDFRRAALLEVHVPFFVIEATVQVDPKRGSRTFLYGLDAVVARLDLYQFDEEPAVEPLLSGRRLQVRLSPDQGEQALEDRVRRLLFERGFFAIKELKVRAASTGRVLHVPYWVGVYRRGEEVRLEVLDAVRGALEGGRLRELMEEGLRGEP